MTAELDPEIRALSIQRFAKLACNGDLWLLAAKKLIASARLMMPEIARKWELVSPFRENTEIDKSEFEVLANQLQSVCLMIIAFALENVMKASLVVRRRESFHAHILQTGTLPNEVRIHDLLRLAKLCGLQLGDEDSRGLKRLTEHAVWIGRYHFSLNFKEFYHLGPGKNVPSSGISHSSDELEKTRTLFNSISNKLGFKITM